VSEVSKKRLKMLVRLLRVTKAAENHLRDFLSTEHDNTLPRFDVMAALYRKGEPITMSELSRMLLVSNGNATAVVDRLEKQKIVTRKRSSEDGRVYFVFLTADGKKQFERLASSHELETEKYFSNVSDIDLDSLIDILGRISKHD
jgi:DNA-binding MarR family transcriptional regulator